jgi:hypothetical protein
MNFKLLYEIEKEENQKLQKKIRELTIDNELYKIRLKNAKEAINKAPVQDTSISIQQLNIYC